MLPLYWAIVASLGTSGPPPVTVEWWPSEPSWSNYPELFRIVPMARYMVNSLLVAAAAVPITLVIASLAGFGMSQMPADDRQRFVTLSIVLLLIPGAAVWLFRFQILRWLGLLDSLWALIVPAFGASNPLFVLLFYWTFRRIPSEMYEAARLDGAGAGTLWQQLAMPLARPTTVGVVVLTFVLYWSDFIGPVLYIFNPDWYTMPIGLQIINQIGNMDWPLIMAAAVLMTGPVLLLFVLLQRFFLHD
ncbi:MAG: carbohydrate ABC transporter permease, partial [Anaerolineales bacterium]